MTEYDYSPEAYEQHLAKQARIARWVDKTNECTPANPFQPLPDGRSSVGSPGPYALQSNPAPPPTHTSSSGSTSRQKSRHDRRHSTFTTSPQPMTSLGLPLGGSLYSGATQAQLAQPMSATNMTTGPQSQRFPYRSSYVPSSATSAVHQPFGSQTQVPGYPYSQPYSSPPVSAGPQPESPYRAADNASSHPYSPSSVRSLPLAVPSSSAGAVTYVQNPSNQSMVVPLKGVGVVVLPPGQQVQVISAQDYYHAERRNQDADLDYSKRTFFGGLNQSRKNDSLRNTSRR